MSDYKTRQDAQTQAHIKELLEDVTAPPSGPNDPQRDEMVTFGCDN